MIKVGNRKILFVTLKDSLNPRTGGKYLKVLKRDKYQCVLCDRKDFIIVHHLNANLDDNKMDNLLTVCKSCHADLHGQTLSIRGPKLTLIKELRQEGLTLAQIGDYLGISRQRVHQIIKKSAKKIPITIENHA